eukprot:4913740-Pyramimonas_sp.AAC.1
MEFLFLDVARPRQAIGRAERLSSPPGGVPKGVGGRRPRIVKEEFLPQSRNPTFLTPSLTSRHTPPDCRVSDSRFQTAASAAS